MKMTYMHEQNTQARNRRTEQEKNREKLMLQCVWYCDDGGEDAGRRRGVIAKTDGPV